MPEAGDAVVNEALESVIRDHGWRVTLDPPRLRASLSDVLGYAVDDHRGLVDALVVSAEEGTPRTVRDAGVESMAERRPELVAQLEAWGLTSDRAGWVVDAWTDLLPARTDMPVVVAPPSPEPVTDDPTVLPDRSPGHRPGGPLAAKAAAVPTALPDKPFATPSRAPGRDQLEKSNPGGHRTLVIAGAAAALVVAGTGITFAVTRAHGPSADSGPQSDPPPTSTSPNTAKPLAIGRVRPAPTTRPPKAKGRFVMADQAGGVQLAALGTVTSMGTGKHVIMAPPGGTLVAFSVSDWCPASPCKPWEKLGLRVAVGGASKRLPTSGKTFVVAVPKGEHDVKLSLKGSGHQQELSLIDGRPGKDNIVALTRKLGPHRVPATANSVRTATQLSGQPLLTHFPWGTSDHFTSHVVVSWVELRYFAGGLTPTSPDEALLYVHAYYDLSRYGSAQRGRFGGDEVSFVPAGGRPVSVITTPFADDDHAEVYVFKVPARTTHGRFMVGGRGLLAKTTSGTSYHLSVSTARVPISLG